MHPALQYGRFIIFFLVKDLSQTVHFILHITDDLNLNETFIRDIIDLANRYNYIVPPQENSHVPKKSESTVSTFSDSEPVKILGTTASSEIRAMDKDMTTEPQTATGNTPIAKTNQSYTDV